MAKDAKKGSSKIHNERERAKMAGKGRTPDFAPGSDEGATFVGEIGLRGDDVSLHGYRTPEQDRRENEKRYHPPASSPPETR